VREKKNSKGRRTGVDRRSGKDRRSGTKRGSYNSPERRILKNRRIRIRRKKLGYKDKVFLF
jgi:hypothetical protein